MDFDSLPDDSEKYDTAGQTALAGVEGAGRGLLGPIPDVLQKFYETSSPKDIRGREEAHPIASGVGQAAGLIGGALTGTGEAALLEGAGKSAAEAVGLGAPTTYAAKVGSSIVKNAAETAILQGSDETSKMILQDPNSSAESAMANIGLAAALGGGVGGLVTGAVSPLWSASKGPQLVDALKALTSRLGGVEGATADAVSGVNKAANLEAQSGIALPNEIKGVINETPGFMENHSILSQTDNTIAGRAYQKTLHGVEDDAASKVIKSLGRSPESIDSLPEVDKYNTGRGAGETLKSEFEDIAGPIDDRYEAINNEFKATSITEGSKAKAADDITQKSLELGWPKAESDAADNLAKKVIGKLDNQETVEDLKKFITNLNDNHPYDTQTYQAAKEIRKILTSNLEDAVSNNIIQAGGNSAQAAAKVAKYNALRSDYRKLMQTADNLNEHLHVGKYGSPKSFASALGELSSSKGEDVLNRLSGKTKADVLNQLQNFPKTLEKIKQYHIDSLLNQATKKASPGTKINVNTLLKNVNELSPQLKNLIATPEQHRVINSAGEILDSLKDPNHNFSNTARTIRKMTGDTPSALSLLATFAGHAEVGVLSFIGKLGFSEGKDALKLGMMKFLSSDQPIKAEGLKSAVAYINAAQKADNQLSKAAGNMFKASVPALTNAQMPTSSELQKLDKLVAKNQEQPETQLNAQNPQSEQYNADKQSHLGHYMPEHQTAITQASTQALGYLQQLKPQPYQPSPLDRPVEPTAAQTARYERALSIAQQPLVVMQHAKDGTLQVSDIQDISSMYPAYYHRMVQKVSNHMLNAHSNEDAIPYRTRIGASLLLGQPLDSSMQPNSIMAAQPQLKPQPEQQGTTKKGTSTLGKSNSNYKTPSQAAESDRSNRD